MTKASDIEAELTKTLKVAKKPDEQRQKLLKRVHKAAMDCDKEVWDNLSEAAQQWASKNSDRIDEEKPLLDFDGEEGAASGKAKEAPAAKGKGKAPAKGAKATSDGEKSPAKGKAAAGKGKKAAPEASGKGKAAGNGESRAVGSKGISAGWAKVLRDLGKKGEAGATLENMEAFGEKHGVGGRYFARFIKLGYIARIERGQFKLTRAGEKALDAI